MQKCDCCQNDSRAMSEQNTLLMFSYLILYSQCFSSINVTFLNAFGLPGPKVEIALLAVKCYCLHDFIPMLTDIAVVVKRGEMSTRMSRSDTATFLVYLRVQLSRFLPPAVTNYFFSGEVVFHSHSVEVEQSLLKTALLWIFLNFSKTNGYIFIIWKIWMYVRGPVFCRLNVNIY